MPKKQIITIYFFAVLVLVGGVWFLNSKFSGGNVEDGGAQSGNYQLIQNLKYSSIDSRDVNLDLYKPTQGCNGELPLVIRIHGGAFKGGDKVGGSGVMADFWTGNCYAFASLDYRLSGEAEFPAANNDVKSAVRWLRANAKKYGLDGNKFGVIGESAGGYFSSFLGVAGDIKDFDTGDNLDYSSSVQAVIDEYGLIDFTNLAQDRADIGARLSNVEIEYIGCDISSASCKNAITASLSNYVSSDDPPFLILHGEKDNQIPLKQSQRFYEALKSKGVAVTFITVPAAGHGGPEFNNYRTKKLEFFNRYLKGKS